MYRLGDDFVLDYKEMFPLATGRSGIKLGARTNNTHLRNVLVKCTLIIFIAIC